MDVAAQEQYVFHYLTLIDMERTRTSLEHLLSASDTHVQEALFRDAVICYAKAFSGNRNLAGKNVLRLDESFVPTSLEHEHKQALILRNKIVAHIDLDFQKPEVSVIEIDGKKKVTFCVTGYEHLFTADLVTPLNDLAARAHAFCLATLEALEGAA